MTTLSSDPWEADMGHPKNQAATQRDQGGGRHGWHDRSALGQTPSRLRLKRSDTSLAFAHQFGQSAKTIRQRWIKRAFGLLAAGRPCPSATASSLMPAAAIRTGQ